MVQGWQMSLSSGIMRQKRVPEPEIPVARSEESGPEPYRTPSPTVAHEGTTINRP